MKTTIIFTAINHLTSLRDGFRLSAGDVDYINILMAEYIPVNQLEYE